MNSSSEELKKRFEFYSSILDIVKIFGETEIGTCEVDEEALSEKEHYWSLPMPV